MSAKREAGNKYHDAVKALMELASRIGKNEPLDIDTAEQIIGAVAQHLRPDNVAEFASGVVFASELMRARAPTGPQPLVDVAPPKWKAHKDKKGRKTHWMENWQGMHLRVMHNHDVAGKVIFEGYIGDVLVTAEKKLRLAQSAVEAEALRRLRTR